MTAFVSHTSIDCTHAYELSEWWKKVLGYVDLVDDPNLPGHEECMIRSEETDHHLLFIEVPEPKRTKNRWHLDLRPVDGTLRDEEAMRLRDLGAELVDDRRVEGGGGWVVFADPEGNEFCLLRSEAEIATGPAARA